MEYKILTPEEWEEHQKKEEKRIFYGRLSSFFIGVLIYIAAAYLTK